MLPIFHIVVAFFLHISVSHSTIQLERRKPFEDDRINCNNVFPTNRDFPPGLDVSQYRGQLVNLCGWEKSENNLGCVCTGTDLLVPTCDERLADQNLYHFDMGSLDHTLREYCMLHCSCEKDLGNYRISRQRAIGSDGFTDNIVWPGQLSLSRDGCNGQEPCIRRSRCHKRPRAYYDPDTGLRKYKFVCVPRDFQKEPLWEDGD